jgi:hypothetical protein
MTSCGQNLALAAARKSAIWLALAYQRVLASLKAAVSPAFAAWSSSTAMVMWSCSRLVSWVPAASPKNGLMASPMSLSSSRPPGGSLLRDGTIDVRTAIRLKSSAVSDRDCERDEPCD